jgi:diaminopimelate epimerase
MKIAFEKYQGTGNDFIIIDDRSRSFPDQDIELISRLCHRHFGIGSDGLMLIRDSDQTDFEMVFYNPDGSKSLCGNGSRCAVAYANKLGIANDEGKFLTTDGIHAYKLTGEAQVAIHMHDVSMMDSLEGHRFIHTGSPHLIVQTPDVDQVDVVTLGRQLRYRAAFKEMGGTNVNFVSDMGEACFGVRTYERGVEGETLSCGTGVTAVALAMAMEGKADALAEIHTHGGVLKVHFKMDDNKFTDIWLEGPVGYVFSGEI